MYILDTDSLSILEHSGENARRLLAKLSTLQANELAVTIISYEEQMRGWLSFLARAKSIQAQVERCSDRFAIAPFLLAKMIN